MMYISANEAVLLYGRAEQIRADPNFQESNCEAFQAAYNELRANEDFFRNLDFRQQRATPLPATFFNAIKNTTTDTNSVVHLLDTTFNTADTNSSSSVNPMLLEGTLHHQYIATDIKDYVADNEEEDSNDDTNNNRKQRSVVAPLLNMSSEQTMTEESTGAQDFGGEATQNATVSSGEILDVRSVKEVPDTTDENGPTIIMINHAPVSVGGIMEAVATAGTASPSIKPQQIQKLHIIFPGVHLLAALSLLILIPGVLCFLPTPQSSVEAESLYLHGNACIQTGFEAVWESISHFHEGSVMLGENMFLHPSILPAIFSWFICWIVAVFCLQAFAKHATNPTPRTNISINLMKQFH